MRGAPLVVVTALVLVEAACGGGPSTAHGTPSSAATVGSTTARSTTATVSFGSPVPATPTARVTAPAQPTTTAAVPARSPAPTSPPGPCTPGDVSITTSTATPNGLRYSSGETVNVKVVVHNLSARGCLFTAPGDFAIEPNPTGEPVYAVHLGCPTTGCEPLDPRVGTLTYPVPWTHQIANQGQYAGQQAPNGVYHARAAFTGYPVSISAPFTIG